jgi:mycofactocin system glycosyltransferase
VDTDPPGARQEAAADPSSPGPHVAPDHLAGVSVVLDPDVEVADGGRALIGGSPVGVTRLTAAGAAMVRRCVDGAPVPGGAGATALVRRLLDRGVLHPVPRAGTGPGPGDVTLVVPTRGPLDPALVDHLVGALDDRSVAAVVVVDDGGDLPADLVDHPRARVVRREVNGGPAAARNTGLEEATTAVVAFVDADCVPTAGWLDALLPHLADPYVAAVAPRVLADAGAGPAAATARDRYEVARGVLDLGDRPARVRAGTRVGHVPATALVARVEAMRAVAGFAEALRVGEDVDLVWRLDQAGWTVRYEPASRVVHRSRSTLRGWLAQREAYGASTGPLAERHPRSIAPLEVPATTVAVWLLAAGGHPVAGSAVALGTAGALSRRLDGLDAPLTTAAALTATAHGRAVAATAAAVTRPWWPLALLGLVPRRTRPLVAAALLAPPLVAWARRRPPLDPVRWTALWLADDVAYGTGVWRGSWRARTVRPLVPILSGVPWRRRQRADDERGRRDPASGSVS